LSYVFAIKITVTRKNQTTLPASIAAKAGISPGYRLNWSLGENGELHAKPLPPLDQVVKSLRGRGKKVYQRAAVLLLNSSPSGRKKADRQPVL
jgi:hypothetical protein